MGMPVGWWENGDDDTYTLWNQDPRDYGESIDGMVPLYDGWKEAYEEISKTLEPGEVIKCNEDGTFYKVVSENYIFEETKEDPVESDSEDVPEYPEENDDVWSEIADAIREGINS